MNCKRCGTSLARGDLFCPVCGERYQQDAPVNHAGQGQNTAGDAQVPPVYQEAYPMGGAPISGGQPTQTPGSPPGGKNGGTIQFRVDKKKATIALVAVAALVLIVVTLVIVLKLIENKKLKEPIQVDLGQYISSECIIQQSVDYYAQFSETRQEEYSLAQLTNAPEGVGLIVQGYDSYATIDQQKLYNVIDWAALNSDVTAQVQKKKGHETDTGYSVEGGNAFFAIDNFTFSADKMEGIQNGDSIIVTVGGAQNQLQYDDITFVIVATQHSYEMNGLKEVHAIDPFEYIQLYSFGANGSARLEVEVEESLNKPIEDLNGFQVVYESKEQIAIAKNGYTIAKIRFSVDTSSLDGKGASNGDVVVVTCDSEQKEQLESDYSLVIVNLYKKYQIEGLGDYIGKDYKMGSDELADFRQDANARIEKNFSNSSYYADFTFESAYLLDRKDKTQSYSNSHNELLLIYSYYDKWSQETEYMYINYLDLIAFEDAITQSPESYYYSDSTGYDSVDDILDNYGDSYLSEKVQ